MRVNVLLFQFKCLYKIFVKELIETNVNKSNEHNFPSGSFTLHATKCRLHLDKPQKNEIHSLINRHIHCNEEEIIYVDTSKLLYKRRLL